MKISIPRPIQHHRCHRSHGVTKFAATTRRVDGATSFATVLVLYHWTLNGDLVSYNALTTRGTHCFDLHLAQSLILSCGIKSGAGEFPHT